MNWTPLDIAVRVGCHLTYETSVPTPVLFVLRPRPEGRVHVMQERLTFGIGLPSSEFQDSHGNLLYRSTFMPGRNEVRHDALVAVSSQPDSRNIQGNLVPVGELPHEMLRYTLPSRYCDSDKLLNFAWNQFWQIPHGLARVQAICDWVHNNIEYRFGSGRPDLSASEVIFGRHGVCRDFAHAVIALCRAFNFPARYVTGHLPDIGYLDPGTPMDFHAYCEVYLGQEWLTFDARHNVPRIGRVKVAHGADAVDDLVAKDRVVKLAESIRGVLGVIDLTTVTPVSRSDEDLRKDIQTALRQDPATESYSVNVSVRSAVVTLTGSVGYYPEKQLATRLAHGVKGVKEVRNQVSIDYLGQRTDPAIAADVNARVRWDIWVSGGRINSAVTHGKVTLSGTIGSAIGRSRAFDDVWVNGVISVDDSGLQIDPSPRHEVSRELKSAARSNSVVKHAILAAFRLDPRVAIFSPDVNVEDGVVVLDGTVGNLKARSAAEQDAKNIVSVCRVVNLLTVRLTAWPSDADMQNQLKAALLRDSLLERSVIDVAVIDHVAYLSGAVDSF